MAKKFLVSSAVQAALVTEVLLPEMATGFWKDHRPANHAAQWADVSIEVSDTDQLGPVDFKVPRLYNFVNPDFLTANEARLVEVAQAVKPTSNFRSVKKELIELSRIAGGRLTSKTGTPTKANRGNNKAGTIQESVKVAKTVVKKATEGVKKTAVKKDANVTIQKTSNGATVRRVAVTREEPQAEGTVEVLTASE